MARKFYAVKNGRDGDGIYLTWEDCKARVEGVPGVRYKGFPTREEAQAFLGLSVGEEPQKPSAPPAPVKAGWAVAYVDGSFHTGTGEFSCGAVLFWEGQELRFSKKYRDEDMASMHNVAGEIMGAVSVIHWCLNNGVPALEIHHDYEGVAKWANGAWKANKDGTRAYADFCRGARRKMKIAFVKVKGHSGDYWNDLADSLAKEALGI